MNKEEDNASDSETDEEYCVEAESADGTSDDSETGSEESGDEADNRTSKSRRNKVKPNNIPKNTSRTNTEESSTSRKTRQSNGDEKGRRNMEKAELPSDEETDKSHSDALWADFLSDVGTPAETKKKTVNGDTPVKKLVDEKSEPRKTSRTAKTEEAAEEVEKPASRIITKEIEEQPASSPGQKRFFGAPKRPSNGAGVGSLINQLGKKKKLSVLEKSQMDWKSFKNDEGIDEELRTHNKGKDGYLERQDFLQRIDLRQFEIEKNLRHSRRQN